MPYAGFGETISFGSDVICRLKAKGDKVTFRILDKPYYEGKHFIKIGKEFEVYSCPRVNEQQPCEWCEKFFTLMKKAKNEAKTESEEKDLRTEAREYKAAVSFYYPILDREQQKFRVFKTSTSVRNALEAEAAAGVPILERDFVVVRTELPGSDYYKVTRVDSADSKPISEQEKHEIAKSKKIPLTELIGVSPKADDESETSFQANTRRKHSDQPVIVGGPSQTPQSEFNPAEIEDAYSSDVPF